MSDIENECYRTFEESLQICTDNEGYSSALRKWANRDGYRIGCIDYAIKFCPWCGKEK